MTSDPGQQCRTGNSESQGSLATIATVPGQHRSDMGSFDILESFGRRSRADHGIDPAIGGIGISIDEMVARPLDVHQQWCQVRGVIRRKHDAERECVHVNKLSTIVTAVSSAPAMIPATAPEQIMSFDLGSLKAGDQIHHPLLVQDVVKRGGDHPRTTVILGNRSGRIESAPFWAGRDEMVQGLAKGMLVQVVGNVTSYRDSLQLEVSSLRPLPPGSIPLEDLVPSVGPVDRYWSFLDETRAKIAAPRLRAAVDLFFEDDLFRQDFEQCPGAPGTGHHALLGGLLQHTSEVVAIGRQIARIARADEDLVVAGAMLHDIGKLQSYTWREGVFDTTVAGRMMGHVAIGALMFQEAVRTALEPAWTDDEVRIMLHFILSHHGRLEYGAAVPPATLEAEIIHFADDASAKTAAINEAYQSRELFPDDATISNRRVWQLDNRWLIKSAPDFGRDESGEGKKEAADQPG